MSDSWTLVLTRGDTGIQRRLYGLRLTGVDVPTFPVTTASPRYGGMIGGLGLAVLRTGAHVYRS